MQTTIKGDNNRSADRQARISRLNNSLVLVAVIEVFILIVMSYAWYYYQAHRRIYSEYRDVMPPYCLYLVEPDGTSSLNLTVGNLHPGETKQIIVGVSNKPPGDSGDDNFKISRDSGFNYEFELAYTKNLPVSYKVYELHKTDTEGANTVRAKWLDSDNRTVTQLFDRTALARNEAASAALTDKNNTEMYGADNITATVNLGQYDVYDKTSGASFDLTTVVNGAEVEFDLDYYMIEIEWQEDITFSDFLKETDLVYVNVKALQMEPKEP